MYREAPDVGSRTAGRAKDRRPAPVSPSLQGELRHVYLLPDVPQAAAPADEQDASWETVFAHVRRLVRGQAR